MPIRLAEPLKTEAETEARRSGVSLNALCSMALRGYLDAKKSPVASSSAIDRAFPAPAQQPPHPPVAKVGVNQPCPCGSGKKYKHCGGSKV
jgi:uncharacterized protein YecA (UPF0149 family)